MPIRDMLSGLLVNLANASYQNDVEHDMAVSRAFDESPARGSWDDPASHHAISHHHGSFRHRSHRHRSHRHQSHHRRTDSDEEDQPDDQIIQVHHQIFLDGVPNPYEIQRTNYEQDRGDCYKAAWKRERQLAKQYHADADAYDELYHEERYRRHAENRKARRAQRDHYLQGYEDGWGYSQEIGGRAVRKQARQYEKTRREDYQRYDQGVYDAYEYGRQPGQQRGRSKKKTPRPASPNNHSHRVTYQDRQSNDAAYRHRGQWHGYAETEYDD